MSEIKFRKIHGGYDVMVDGVRVGAVWETWRKVYGGAAWDVKIDGERRTFTTRRDAARFLVETKAAK